MKFANIPMRIKVIVWSLIFASHGLLANGDKCSQSLQKSNSKQSIKTEVSQASFKKSDQGPSPQLWLRIKQSLQKNVSHLEHPFETAGLNADRVGETYLRMKRELPLLGELLDLERKIDAGFILSHADYIPIKRRVGNQLLRVMRSANSDLESFAALESLRLISLIEARVEFPRIESESSDEKNSKNKEGDAEKDKDKDKEKERQKNKDQDSEDNEDDPQWNEPPEKYKPENKDLSSGGKGKKTVEITLTDAEVYKNLMRQVIYDQFGLTGEWTSVPAVREAQQTEATFSKKLVVNPLKEKIVDLPIPYGYSPIPGKYADHRIEAVGPGQFKVHSVGNKPVTIGLAKIIREAALPLPLPSRTDQELKHWPQHLLLFVNSLKGKAPLEAAAQLEKYLSLEGGFLYYSKGDKLKAGDLAKIDAKIAKLKARMPEPMALANAGAFNCDGAAWIGALLLRDVLKLQVRIVGGRTSQEKTVEGERLQVVLSSSPPHAWIEVFDGQRWVPFDMTPKNNTPDSQTTASEVDREQKDQSRDKNKSDKDASPKGTQSSSDEEQDRDKNSNSEKDNDADRKDDASQDSSEQDQQKESGKGEKEKSDSDKESENQQSQKNQVDDLINAKSTQRRNNEQNLALIEHLLKRNELIHLEKLISEGYQTNTTQSATLLLETLRQNPVWKNPIERSAMRVRTLIHDAKFANFTGLRNLLIEVRNHFSKNEAREGKQKLLIAQKLLITLAEYRNLTSQENEALQTLDRLLRVLDQIKHEYAKEFDMVATLLDQLPGSVSKAWLRKQYGADFEKLGSSGNLKLASDLVDGRGKPLLQMAGVRNFVDMTFDSTQDPQWKEEVTLNRSIIPKPRQDLVITRNPLDFPRMLWSLRPGEPIFAPTIQGRQFALSSLETRRVESPHNPLERKVSVIYYDVSPSMDGSKMETQDALLMAFVDKALSEVDAISRPVHEIYLIPFNDRLLQGVHISSREDALGYLSQRMNSKTTSSGSTDIQKALENFYEIIATSFKNKGLQGRERLFQRANMVLFSDGGSEINMATLERKRKLIPDDVTVNMNFVSIGDDVNTTLKALSENGRLASAKPAFRQITQKMTDSIANVTTSYDPEAFATTERITGPMLAELKNLLERVSIHPEQSANLQQVERKLNELKITKEDLSRLPGVREAMNLSQISNLLTQLSFDNRTKQRLLEALVEPYTQLTGRPWSQMSYPEKDAFEQLQKWIKQ